MAELSCTTSLTIVSEECNPSLAMPTCPAEQACKAALATQLGAAVRLAALGSHTQALAGTMGGCWQPC